MATDAMGLMRHHIAGRDHNGRGAEDKG